MYIFKSEKITEEVIQRGLAIFLNYRTTMIVPNVSWGWSLRHEADIVYVRNNVATEIEIKLTRADFLADFNKKHNHSSFKISRLVFCLPKQLQQIAEQSLDVKIGLICFERINVDTRLDKIVFTKIRQGGFKTPKHILSSEELIALLRLGCMRQWSKT